MDVSSPVSAGPYAAGMTFTEPRNAVFDGMETANGNNSLPARTATVWGVVESELPRPGGEHPRGERAPLAGGRCALTAQNQHESFQSLTAEGYLDLHRTLGVDGMVAFTPGGANPTGELEIDSCLPNQLCPWNIGLRHKLRLQQSLSETTQSIILSLPLSRLGSKARLTLSQKLGKGLSRTTFEIGNRIEKQQTAEPKSYTALQGIESTFQERLRDMNDDANDEMRIHASKRFSIDIVHKTHNSPSSVSASWSHAWMDRIHVRTKTTVRGFQTTSSMHCRFCPSPLVHCSFTVDSNPRMLISAGAKVTLTRPKNHTKSKSTRLIFKISSRYTDETGEISQDLKLCRSDQFEAQCSVQGLFRTVRPRILLKVFIPFLSNPKQR
jgi:hypothetical protein